MVENRYMYWQNTNALNVHGFDKAIDRGDSEHECHFLKPVQPRGMSDIM